MDIAVATLGGPAKWRLQNKHRKSCLVLPVAFRLEAAYLLSVGTQTPGWDEILQLSPPSLVLICGQMS